MISGRSRRSVRLSEGQTERAAWGLIAFAAAFWLWFGIASAIGEHLGAGNAVLHVLVPGGIFAMLGMLARRWRTPAAVALIAVGTFMAIAYPLVYLEFFPASTVALVFVTMAVPTLVAGILLLLSRRRAGAAGPGSSLSTSGTGPQLAGMEQHWCPWCRPKGRRAR